MKVSEVMTRDVQTVSPDQPVQEAANFMLSADAGSIPVIEGERLIGMITDRDIAVRGIAKGYGPDTPVRELMTDDLIVVRVDDDVEEAATQNERRPGPQAAGHRRATSGFAASSASATLPRKRQ